jgi:hypothetical protein
LAVTSRALEHAPSNGSFAHQIAVGLEQELIVIEHSLGIAFSAQ